MTTGASIAALFLATVFGPFQAFLKTTHLDVQQWLICGAVALSVIVVSEIRKAVRQRNHPGMGEDIPQPLEEHAGT